MRVGKIKNMDVIAQARAVARLIIRSENLKRLAAPKQRQKRERDRMTLRLMALAQPLAPRSAGGVEIAQVSIRTTTRRSRRFAQTLRIKFVLAIGARGSIAVRLVH